MGGSHECSPLTPNTLGRVSMKHGGGGGGSKFGGMQGVGDTGQGGDTDLGMPSGLFCSVRFLHSATTEGWVGGKEGGVTPQHPPHGTP